MESPSPAETAGQLLNQGNGSTWNGKMRLPKPIRHPELLSRLLSHIRLPVPVVQAIREFFERQVRGQAAGMSMLARGLGTANQIAHGLLLTASIHETVAPISRTEWRLLAGDKEPPPLDPIKKRNEILGATNLLARLPANEEQRMITPILARVRKHIWYVRPENFIELDPLAYALSQMSDLTISSVFPKEERWAGIDGIVVVGIRAGTPPIIPTDLAQACQMASRPDLPILALLGQGDLPADVGHLTFRSFPISLGDLHAWVTGKSAPAN